MEYQVRVKEPQFVVVAGLKRVYEPARAHFGLASKHPCTDCHCCQFCSDARCHACRGSPISAKQDAPPRMSIREQIAYYDRINCMDSDPCSDI